MSGVSIPVWHRCPLAYSVTACLVRSLAGHRRYLKELRSLLTENFQIYIIYVRRRCVPSVSGLRDSVSVQVDKYLFVSRRGALPSPAGVQGAYFKAFPGEGIAVQSFQPAGYAALASELKGAVRYARWVGARLTREAGLRSRGRLRQGVSFAGQKQHAGRRWTERIVNPAEALTLPGRVDQQLAEALIEAAAVRHGVILCDLDSAERGATLCIDELQGLDRLVLEHLTDSGLGRRRSVGIGLLADDGFLDQVLLRLYLGVRPLQLLLAGKRWSP